MALYVQVEVTSGFVHVQVEVTSGFVCTGGGN